MARENWVNYGIFFVGVVLIVGSLAVGIGGLRYEFQHVSSTDETTTWDRPLFEYDQLSDDEQRIVDDAIRGERFVFDRQDRIPGIGGAGLGTRELIVVKRDTYHVFTFQAIFVSTTPAGMGAIGLALGGVLTVAEAIRRTHFPHVHYPWQSG